MVAIVGIISRHGLRMKCIVETSLITVSFHCISCSFHLNSYLKQQYISNKSAWVIKVGMVWCVSKHLKEELAWAIDKWLQATIKSYNVIKNSFYTTKILKSKAVLNLKQYCVRRCVVCHRNFCPIKNVLEQNFSEKFCPTR